MGLPSRSIDLLKYSHVARKIALYDSSGNTTESENTGRAGCTVRRKSATGRRDCSYKWTRRFYCGRGHGEDVDPGATAGTPGGRRGDCTRIHPVCDVYARRRRGDGETRAQGSEGAWHGR